MLASSQRVNKQGQGTSVGTAQIFKNHIKIPFKRVASIRKVREIFVSHFFNISRGFNFANWPPVDFSRGFIFANLSFINVLHILIFSWFVLRLVVCESRKSYPNFSIFQQHYLDIKDLILDWMHRRSKGADIIKRFTFLFLCCLYLLIVWYSVKYFWHDHC